VTPSREDETLYTFSIAGLGHEFSVVHFEGREGLSELFRFDITLAGDADIDFEEVIGSRAVLTLHAGKVPRRVHGIVASFEQGDEGKKLTSYRAALVPDVWRLLHRHDCRIFQSLSVPDILCKVLDAAGASSSGYRLSLRDSYAPRDYCVQYRESD